MKFAGGEDDVFAAFELLVGDGWVGLLEETEAADHFVEIAGEDGF